MKRREEIRSFETNPQIHVRPSIYDVLMYTFHTDEVYNILKSVFFGNPKITDVTKNHMFLRQNEFRRFWGNVNDKIEKNGTFPMIEIADPSNPNTKIHVKFLVPIVQH